MSGKLDDMDRVGGGTQYTSGKQGGGEEGGEEGCGRGYDRRKKAKGIL